MRPRLAPLALLPLLAGCGDTLRAADAAWNEFTRPAPPEHVLKAPAYAVVPDADGGAPRLVALAPFDGSLVGLGALATAATANPAPVAPARAMPVALAPEHAPTKPAGHAAPAKARGPEHGPAHDNDDGHGAKADAAHGGAPTKSPPHWGYHEGPDGPRRWADLSPAFAACGEGQKQSPIDLKGAEQASLLPALVFHYEAGALKLKNNGHTVQADMPPGSWVEIGGVRYDLRQFHLHGPSEHTIDGKAVPLEAHLVHENAHGQLAVVGVMIEAGAENATLNLMARHAPHDPGVRAMPETTLHPHALLPLQRGYWRYVGSLTTPPCSEGVAWHVMRTPVTASKETIAALTRIMPPHNARPVQPLNGRTLVQR